MRRATYFSPTELKMFEKNSPIFNPEQMKMVNKKTPSSEIEQKQEGNLFVNTVKSAYVKALVALVTGGNFTFEIKSYKSISSTSEVLAECRLTIFTDSGKPFTREQFGQFHVNSKPSTDSRNPKSKPSDIGNAYKAAASDGFKKCASEFGFCWDIYGQEIASQKKDEQPKLNHADIKKLERLAHFLSGCKSETDAENVYKTFLETSEETDDSERIYTQHLNRHANSLKDQQ